MDRLLEEFLKSIADSPGSPTTPGDNVECAGSMDSNYRQRLRSYSSFPAGAATTSSDTTISRADLMDVTYVEAQSLSDGAGTDQRRRVRRQVRKRLHKNRADKESGRRRAYGCDVCGQTFPSPQSLGGHKNLHKGGKNKKGLFNSSRNHQGLNSSCESSGFKGVRCREGTKWVSEIRPPKSSDKWWLGTFPSAEEAAQAYDVALCYFHSETDLNFDLHPLCKTLPPIPPDLSPNEFALRLREMVRDISEQIIADRRAQALASSRPTVSGDSSTTAEGSTILPDLPTLDFVTLDDPFDPLQFLKDYDGRSNPTL